MYSLTEQGSFRDYANIRLDEARSHISELNYYSEFTTVFMSHKHDDLEDLKGLIGFLENKYKVKVYIDSKDSNMPSETSADTAKILKDRIRNCDRFILLATNGAIESKWCNWELGFGDAKKFPDRIAIFPMKPKNTYDHNYKGNEYFDLYPYIIHEDGTSKYNTGEYIQEGYYVVRKEKGQRIYTSLGTWLSK